MGERECVFVCLFGSCSAAMQARQGHAYACVLALYKVFVGIYAFPVIVMICNNYLRILFLMPLVISLYDGNRLSHSSLDGESGLFYQYISVISLWFDLKIKSGCFRNRNLLEWQVLSLTTRHFDDNYCNSEKP